MTTRHRIWPAVALALSLSGAHRPATAQPNAPVGKAAPTQAPAGKAAPTRPDPGQLSAAELDEIGDTKRILWKFELVVGNHIERLPEAGRNPLARRTLLRVIEARNQLVGRLEAYLDTRPQSAQITARAMELLGDLYLDQWNTADRYQMFTDGEDDADFVAALQQHYTMGQQPALEVWEALVARFPRYPRNPDILDELAQAYLDLGRNDDAKRVLLRLLCSNRAVEFSAASAAQSQANDSIQARVYANTLAVENYTGCVTKARDRELVADAWMRLARLHRASYGEGQLAVAAYEQVIAEPDAPSYPAALQELADTYAETGQLLEAIPMLDDLVLFLAGQTEHRDARSSSEPGGAMLEPERHEAIERIGKILAQLWRDSAVPDPDSSLKLAKIYYHRQRNQQPHVREVFVELGVALHDFGAFEQAVPVWRYVLTSWPRHPDAPKVEEMIVDLLIEKGDTGAADAERRKLIATFGPGSAWRTSNQKNRMAITSADRLTEDALFELATNGFRQVTIAVRDGALPATGGLPAEVEVLFREVTDLSTRYLADYPRSKRNPEIGFALARTQLYRGDYLAAARRFRALRQSEGVTGRYYEPATQLMVQAYEQAVAAAVAAGSLSAPAVPDKKALAKAGAPRPLPELYAEVQRAYQEGAELATISDAAKMALAAARVDLRFSRIDQAEAQLHRIVIDYCQTSAAQEARSHLVDIYEARGDDSVGSAATKLLSQACGDSKPVLAMRRAQIEKELQEGRQQMALGRHVAAARKFLAAYQLTDAGHDLRDDSLLAAAQALAAAGRAGAALTMLRDFSRDPGLKNSELRAEALALSAEVHASTFDYEGAVDAYLRLVALAGERSYKPRAGFDLAGAAEQALWQAAILREMDRVFYDRNANDPGAASLFKRYAAAVRSDRDRASQAYLRAGQVYKQAGDVNRLVATFDEWKKGHARDPNAAYYELHFDHQIAEALGVVGDRQRAAKVYRELVAAYDRIRKPEPAEAELAGEAQFWLAEESYQQKLHPFLFVWPADLDSEGGQRLDQLVKLAEQTSDQFEQVLRFESSWSVAALTRMGDVWLDTADKVLSAPPPIAFIEEQKKTNGELASLDVFVDFLREAIQPVYDRASGYWQQGFDLARAKGWRTEWAKQAQQRLNTHVDRQRFPVLRDEIVVKEVSP